MARQPTQDNKGQADQPSGTSDAIALLKADHADIRQKLEALDSDENGGTALRDLAEGWARHSQAEEQLFAPAAREAGLDEATLAENAIERDLVTILLLDLRRACNDAAEDLHGAEVKARMMVARKYLSQIMDAEESQRSGLFAKAKAAGLDVAALGEKIARHRQDAGKAPPLRVRHLSLNFGQDGRNQEDYPMQRQYERERDDQGRFVSDDDRDYGGRRSYRGRERDDDDRRYSSRDRDDDRGRGHGGWFGDPEGHSEASRRGWDDRRDDDRRYATRSRDDDRSYGRRDYDDDRGRGHGGWYGDPEGHSEASRRGWDDRRGGSHDRDDDRRSYSRGRDDNGRYASRDRDDDRRYSRRDDDDRGHGGWFGDSRGHAEAARRGWDHRR